MGLYILGDVKTNIPEGTELWDRLQRVNAIYQYEIVVIQYERQESRGWFRKPETIVWYEIIDKRIDNGVIVKSCDLYGAELYLLGMINGSKIHEHQWVKPASLIEERVPDGTRVRELLTGRWFTIQSSIETDNRWGSGIYLYKMVEGPTPSFGLYRGEFELIQKLLEGR